MITWGRLKWINNQNHLNQFKLLCPCSGYITLSITPRKIQLKTGLKYIWTDNNSQLKHIHQNILIIIFLWRDKMSVKTKRKLRMKTEKLMNSLNNKLSNFSVNFAVRLPINLRTNNIRMASTNNKETVVWSVTRKITNHFAFSLR